MIKAVLGDDVHPDDIVGPGDAVIKLTSGEVAEKQAKVHGHKPRNKVDPTPLSPDGIPDGYRVLDATVYTNGEDIVVTGNPSDLWPEDDGEKHNCDEMGCAWGHVIARAKLENEKP